MENKEENQEDKEINVELATLKLGVENKAFLRILVENQEKILTQLQDRDIHEIIKEREALYAKLVKQIWNETTEGYEFIEE